MYKRPCLASTTTNHAYKRADSIFRHVPIFQGRFQSTRRYFSNIFSTSDRHELSLNLMDNCMINAGEAIIVSQFQRKNKPQRQYNFEKGISIKQARNFGPLSKRNKEATKKRKKKLTLGERSYPMAFVPTPERSIKG